MPVFINEVVVRAEIARAETRDAAEPAAPAGAGERAALVAEIMRAMLDQFERERDRVGER